MRTINACSAFLKNRLELRNYSVQQLQLSQHNYIKTELKTVSYKFNTLIYRQPRSKRLCLTVTHPKWLFSCGDLALANSIQTYFFIFHPKESSYSLSSIGIVSIRAAGFTPLITNFLQPGHPCLKRQVQP